MHIMNILRIIFKYLVIGTLIPFWALAINVFLGFWLCGPL